MLFNKNVCFLFFLYSLNFYSQTITLKGAFVFATLTMVNANTKVEDKVEEIDCIALAYSVDNELGGISYATFKSIVDNCEKMQEVQ